MSDYMKILNILKDDHPTLFVKSETVPEVTDEVKAIASQLLLTMTEAKGVGLAAIQCAIPKRIIVMDTRSDRDNGVMRVLINAEIIARKGSTKYEEGCLSYPGKSKEIKRYQGVRVRYMDLSGKEVIEEFKGLSSICVQHEIDHTNGLTFLMEGVGVK